MWMCIVEFEILMVHESPNITRICFYQYWERKMRALFQFIHQSRKLMVFHLTSPMPSFIMQNKINMIGPFIFPKCIYFCSYMISTVSLQINNTIYFIYMLTTCISLSLLFSGSLFSCIVFRSRLTVWPWCLLFSWTQSLPKHPALYAFQSTSLCRWPYQKWDVGWE